MPTIITVTFSPCIDKSTSVPELIPEKKLKCSSPKLNPGGGGINVTRAIIKLGGEAIAIYPAGGYTGKFFNELLANEKVPSVIIESKCETRENVVVMDELTQQQYRFGMPGTELTEQEWRQCLQAIDEINDVEYIVASGSLPPGVPMNIYAQIAKIARKKNARLIVDTSGEALKHAANEGVYLLKPNLGELSSLLDVKKIAVDEIEAAARSIIEKGHCEVIVVSMGESGAVLVTGKEVHRVSPPRVIRKSTVGAGDSMVAGIVLTLSQNRSCKEILEYGVACGTAATMNSGTDLCRKEDVDKLIELIRSS